MNRNMKATLQTQQSMASSIQTNNLHNAQKLSADIENLANLKSKLYELSAHNVTLETKMSQLSDHHANLESKLSNRHANLDSKLSDHYADLDSKLSDRHANLDSKLSVSSDDHNHANLDFKLCELSTHIITLETKLSQLSNHHDNLESKLSKLSQLYGSSDHHSHSDIDSKLCELSNCQSNLDSKLSEKCSSLELKIQDLQLSNNAIAADRDALKLALEEVLTLVNNNRSSINYLTGILDKNKEKLII